MATEQEGHTPGPWSPGHMINNAHPCNCATIFSETCLGGVATVHVGNGMPISDGGNDSPLLPEAQANARLIAAAPDLLEALREVRRVGDDKMAFRSEWLASVEKADAAIARATGEA